MREIRFRVWDRRNKTMQPVKYLRWLNNDNIASIGCGDEKGYQERLRPRDCELMQFTGHEDKNGVEIYEGDIVKDLSVAINQVVFYSLQRAAFKIGARGEKTQYDKQNPFWNDNCLVIGNIYENPELLKI